MGAHREEKKVPTEAAEVVDAMVVSMERDRSDSPLPGVIVT